MNTNLEEYIKMVEECKKFTDILQDTLDIYYPNGIQSRTCIVTFIMLLSQVMNDMEMSDEEAVNMFKDNYVFYKNNLANARRTS